MGRSAWKQRRATSQEAGDVQGLTERLGGRAAPQAIPLVGAAQVVLLEGGVELTLDLGTGLAAVVGEHSAHLDAKVVADGAPEAEALRGHLP